MPQIFCQEHLWLKLSIFSLNFHFELWNFCNAALLKRIILYTVITVNTVIIPNWKSNTTITLKKVKSSYNLIETPLVSKRSKLVWNFVGIFLRRFIKVDRFFWDFWTIFPSRQNCLDVFGCTELESVKKNRNSYVLEHFDFHV